MKYFSEEQRRRAVDLYVESGGNSTIAVKALGHPSVTALLEWVKDDQRCTMPGREAGQDEPVYATYSPIVSARPVAVDDQEQTGKDKEVEIASLR